MIQRKLTTQSIRYYKRKKAGRCVICNSKPIVTLTLCAVCRDKMHAKRKASKIRCKERLWSKITND